MDNSGQKELIEELDTFLSVLKGVYNTSQIVESEVNAVLETAMINAKSLKDRLDLEMQGQFQLRLDEDRATLHERNESAQTHEEQEAQILKDDFLARNR